MGNSVRGAKEVQDFLRRLAPLLEQNLAVATQQNALRFRDACVRRVTEGDPSWPANAPLTIGRKGSSKPLIDRGDYRSGFRLVPVSKGRIFAGIPRAEKETGAMSLFRLGLVHEFGARISPKKARMLAIPVSREADRLRRQHGGTRNIPGLFRPMGPGGKPRNVLCIRAGRKGKSLVTLFVLKTRVVIPPRPVIQPVLIKERPGFIRNWEAAARAALQGKAYRGVALA